MTRLPSEAIEAMSPTDRQNELVAFIVDLAHIDPYLQLAFGADGDCRAAG